MLLPTHLGVRKDEVEAVMEPGWESVDTRII